MQKRMALSFAIPIILILIPINSLCYHFLTLKYEEKMQYSVEQASTQAVSFLTNYVQTMKYLSDMIKNNDILQEILSSENFNGSRPFDVQYREYTILNDTLMSFEVSNHIYRLGLYISDNLVYSGNHYLFYGESVLEERNDYDKIKNALSNGDNYFALKQEKKAIYAQDLTNAMTMFTQIYSDDVIPKPLNICSVSIDIKNMVQVLNNSNITQEGIVYIVDEYDNILFSSDSEIVEEIKKANNLPLGGKDISWKTVKLGNTNYYVIRKKVEAANWQMVSLIPTMEYNRQQMFIQISQVIMIIIIIVLTYSVAHLLSRKYVRQLTNLTHKMNSLQSGDLNIQLQLDEIEHGDEIEEVYRNFNFMVGEVRRLMQEHYRLGKNVQVAELRALQAQINPHFLYNTLDLINWMAIDYCASDIENLVWNLSRFYRLSLNHGKSIISIREELEHVQMYINIENVHFDNAIMYKVDVPDELLDLACINIIIQPFVENAIVHGIAKLQNIHYTAIEVSAQKEEDDIIFKIKDDGIGISKEQIWKIENEFMKETTEGYGIRNINFRIKLCFGERYGVTYDMNTGKGTIACIRIPSMEMEEAERKIF